jgi:hypothetical protein
MQIMKRKHQHSWYPGRAVYTSVCKRASCASVADLCIRRHSSLPGDMAGSTHQLLYWLLR